MHKPSCLCALILSTKSWFKCLGGFLCSPLPNSTLYILILSQTLPTKRRPVILSANQSKELSRVWPSALGWSPQKSESGRGGLAIVSGERAEISLEPLPRESFLSSRRMGTQANRKQAAGQGGSASCGYYNDSTYDHQQKRFL